MAKPSPKQVARDLRHMLYGINNPSRDDYAQCRRMNVPHKQFARMCGYADYDDIPKKVCSAIYKAGLRKKVRLVIGFGKYTVLVGSDYEYNASRSS